MSPRFSFNSRSRAIKSLLPSGQAGRRAFFIRLHEVAGSCVFHWGKPKGNRRAKEWGTASTIPISSGLAPEGSQPPGYYASYNERSGMPRSPSGLSRWKQRLDCYSAESRISPTRGRWRAENLRVANSLIPISHLISRSQTSVSDRTRSCIRRRMDAALTTCAASHVSVQPRVFFISLF